MGWIEAESRFGCLKVQQRWLAAVSHEGGTWKLRKRLPQLRARYVTGGISIPPQPPNARVIFRRYV